MIYHRRFKLLIPNHTPDIEMWYRAYDQRYANYDPWADFEQPVGSHLEIQVVGWPVKKHTPKGVVLYDGTFVHGKARKQFAVPTIELALQDLVARKKLHLAFAKARALQAQEHLTAAIAALEKARI